ISAYVFTPRPARRSSMPPTRAPMMSRLAVHAAWRGVAPGPAPAHAPCAPSLPRTYATACPGNVSVDTVPPTGQPAWWRPYFGSLTHHLAVIRPLPPAPRVRSEKSHRTDAPPHGSPPDA